MGMAVFIVELKSPIKKWAFAHCIGSYLKHQYNRNVAAKGKGTGRGSRAISLRNWEVLCPCRDLRYGAGTAPGVAESQFVWMGSGLQTRKTPLYKSGVCNSTGVERRFYEPSYARPLPDFNQETAN
jgi:hypothetical protein